MSLRSGSIRVLTGPTRKNLCKIFIKIIWGVRRELPKPAALHQALVLSPSGGGALIYRNQRFFATNNFSSFSCSILFSRLRVFNSRFSLFVVWLSFVSLTAVSSSFPKNDAAKSPIWRGITPIPTKMLAQTTHRPSNVTGTISPNPTVVSVQRPK